MFPVIKEDWGRRMNTRRLQIDFKIELPDFPFFICLKNEKPKQFSFHLKLHFFWRFNFWNCWKFLWRNLEKKSRMKKLLSVKLFSNHFHRMMTTSFFWGKISKIKNYHDYLQQSFNFFALNQALNEMRRR